MDPIPLIQAYFRTHRDREEAAHLALLDPQVRFFGSVSGIRDRGRASYRGVFRAIASQNHLNEAIPRRVLGQWPEFIVFVDLRFEPPGAPRRVLDAVWHFVFNDEGLIEELGIFWSPSGPLELS